MEQHMGLIDPTTRRDQAGNDKVLTGSIAA